MKNKVSAQIKKKKNHFNKIGEQSWSKASLLNPYLVLLNISKKIFHCDTVILKVKCKKKKNSSFSLLYELHSKTWYTCIVPLKIRTDILTLICVF